MSERLARHVLALGLLTLATPALADEPEPSAEETARAPVATVQRRFAVKASTLSLHVLGTAQFRGDLYHRVGYGAALAFYPWEELGFELRAIGHCAWLSEAGEQIRRDTGFIPDTRAPIATALLGARVSFGYGKIQLGEAAVLHFDPQAVLQAGVTLAEDERLLPTALAGLSLLLHFDLGFQAQIDLLAIVDVEDRNDRGAIVSVGFAPFLSFGWRLDLGAL